MAAWNWQGNGLPMPMIPGLSGVTAPAPPPLLPPGGGFPPMLQPGSLLPSAPGQVTPNGLMNHNAMVNSWNLGPALPQAGLMNPMISNPAALTGAAQAPGMAQIIMALAELNNEEDDSSSEDEEDGAAEQKNAAGFDREQLMNAVQQAKERNEAEEREVVAEKARKEAEEAREMAEEAQKEAEEVAAAAKNEKMQRELAEALEATTKASTVVQCPPPVPAGAPAAVHAVQAPAATDSRSTSLLHLLPGTEAPKPRKTSLLHLLQPQNTADVDVNVQKTSLDASQNEAPVEVGSAESQLARMLQGASEKEDAKRSRSRKKSPKERKDGKRKRSRSRSRRRSKSRRKSRSRSRSKRSKSRRKNKNTRSKSRRKSRSRSRKRSRSRDRRKKSGSPQRHSKQVPPPKQDVVSSGKPEVEAPAPPPPPPPVPPAAPTAGLDLSASIALAAKLAAESRSKRVPVQPKMQSNPNSDLMGADNIGPVAPPSEENKTYKSLRLQAIQIRSLLGKQGATINDIRRRSGSDIKIHHPPSEPEGLVSIVGNADIAEKIIAQHLSFKGCPMMPQG